MKLIISIVLAYLLFVGMFISIIKVGKIADERTDRLIKEEIERWSA